MSPLSQDLLESLTRSVVATPGVRGIYPQSVVAAATAGLVRSASSSATGLLTAKQIDDRLVITARLAVESATRTTDVIARVHEVLRRELSGRPFELHIEVAHVD